MRIRVQVMKREGKELPPGAGEPAATAATPALPAAGRPGAASRAAPGRPGAAPAFVLCSDRLLPRVHSSL